MLLGVGERTQEKLFKDWLTQCHRNLDKVTRFEKIGGKELQVGYSDMQKRRNKAASLSALHQLK